MPALPFFSFFFSPPSARPSMIGDAFFPRRDLWLGKRYLFFFDRDGLSLWRRPKKVPASKKGFFCSFEQNVLAPLPETIPYWPSPISLGDASRADSNFVFFFPISPRCARRCFFFLRTFFVERKLSPWYETQIFGFFRPPFFSSA